MFTDFDSWLKLTREAHIEVVDRAGLPNTFREQDTSDEAKRYELLTLRLRRARINTEAGYARLQAQVQQIVSTERNIVDGVPVDMVTTSFSGLDPDISVANARIQAARVAAVRGLDPVKVQGLVDKYTTGRILGVFGEPHVNVLLLNMALDNGEAA